MEKLLSHHKISFSTKVLVPFVTVMVLLVAINVWSINRHLTSEFETEAAQNLSTAEGVFRNSLKIHKNDLLMRFRNLPNEPRYRAAFQSGHLPTLKAQIKDIPTDQAVDVVSFTSPEGRLLASAKRDATLALSDLEAQSAKAVTEALKGEEMVDTIAAGQMLFDIVSLPVMSTSGDIVGVITFATQIGEDVVRELGGLTRSQIVLMDNGRVLASSLEHPDELTDLPRVFNGSIVQGPSVGNAERLKRLTVGDEHYFCAVGRLGAASADSRLGYLLLCSYEQPLQALHRTQQKVVLLSAVGIMLAIAIVWVLLRKVTEPLRLLRDGAEAVGKGDFSPRIASTSSDECGELARVFNRMTENLQRSREELEQTVERLKTTQAQLVQSEKLSGIG